MEQKPKCVRCNKNTAMGWNENVIIDKYVYCSECWKSVKEELFFYECSFVKADKTKKTVLGRSMVEFDVGDYVAYYYGKNTISEITDVMEPTDAFDIDFFYKKSEKVYGEPVWFDNVNPQSNQLVSIVFNLGSKSGYTYMAPKNYEFKLNQKVFFENNTIGFVSNKNNGGYNGEYKWIVGIIDEHYENPYNRNREKQ